MMQLRCENRLVARTLERRWNEKLQQLTELEEAYSLARQVQRLELTAAQRQQILQLANDIPTLWHASCTTNQERKEILGLLVKQVAITPIDAPERSTRVQILWHTGATSELIATRPTNAEKFRTPNEVIQLIEELAPGRTDSEIADELNRRGLVGGTGRAFTKKGVAWIRWKFGIEKPLSNPQVAHKGVSPEGYYSTSALALKLGVGIHTIYYWRDKGIISAFQETPKSPQRFPEIMWDIFKQHDISVTRHQPTT